jgi:hypothetical protein
MNVGGDVLGSPLIGWLGYMALVSEPVLAAKPPDRQTPNNAVPSPIPKSPRAQLIFRGTLLSLNKHDH